MAKKTTLIRITANVPPLTAAKLAKMAKRNFRQPGTEARVAIENHVGGNGK